MGRAPRPLNPEVSPAALFGAELRALRIGRRLSAAALGSSVHVGGDLILKIEKAERRPLPDLVSRLDTALVADGELVRLAAELSESKDEAPVIDDLPLPDSVTAPVLRSVVNRIRDDDHAMASAHELPTMLAYARVAERAVAPMRGAPRDELRGLIAQAYQLAGWMSFDRADPQRASALLAKARTWAGGMDDATLVAFVLGPNASFVATSTGDPGLGVELGYGALGWARRAGNARLTAFTMAIAARAHARLGETRLCLDLLDQSREQLDCHVDDREDPVWLVVFDSAALAGHRGSCLLDLGLPDKAVEPLHDQSTAVAATRFVRNRVIWQLDEASAHLRLHELEAACAAVGQALDLATAITPRVRLRFAGIGLALRRHAEVSVARDSADRIAELIAANA